MKKTSCSAAKAKRRDSGMASIRSRNPILPSRKIAASISFGVPFSTGRKSICASTSRSKSTPGAISVSSMPSAHRRNTARSVT